MLIYDISSVMDVEKSFRRVHNLVFAHLIGPLSYRAAGWGAAFMGLTVFGWFVLARPAIMLVTDVNILIEVVIVAVSVVAAFFIGGKIATSRMAHGKETAALLRSWLTWRTGPRRIVDSHPWKPPRRTRLDTEIATS